MMSRIVPTIPRPNMCDVPHCELCTTRRRRTLCARSHHQVMIPARGDGVRPPTWRLSSPRDPRARHPIRTSARRGTRRWCRPVIPVIERDSAGCTALRHDDWGHGLPDLIADRGTPSSRCEINSLSMLEKSSTAPMVAAMARHSVTGSPTSSLPRREVAIRRPRLVISWATAAAETAEQGLRFPGTPRQRWRRFRTG